MEKNNIPDPDSKKVNSIIDELNAPLDDKKKSGKKETAYQRKKREQEQAEKDFMISISGIGSMLVGFIVERMPNPKPLSPDERLQVDTAFNNVAKKYTTFLGEYQEEVAFVVMTGLILVPRLNLTKKKLPDENKDGNV